MKSHIANLFLIILERIVSLRDRDDNPYFRFVEQDFGQLESPHPPVSWPCVLIDIDDAVFTNLSSNVQQGTVTVILRIGFNPYSSSSNITPAESRKKALYYYDLEQVVYLAFQGHRPFDWLPHGADAATRASMAMFGNFDRSRIGTEQRPEDFIRVRPIAFTIGLQDVSAKATPIFVPAVLNLDTEFTLP